MRRTLAPLLALLLIAGIGFAIYDSMSEQMTLRERVSITGLIGSEKEAFFADPRVQKALEENGLIVKVEKAGSRQIATAYDLKKYDFAFPAGQPAADKILQAVGKRSTDTPFFTPMVIASWRPIATILEANGVVRERDGVYYWFDLDRYFEWTQRETRWKDLKDNAAYPVNKSVLIRSTDVRKSNSAAMYLALMSYIANGQRIIASRDEMDAALPRLAPLFLRQGYTEYSSEGPFENYLAMGMGSSPLVMIYESQFIHEALKEPSAIRPEMVLLYPEPGLFTRHVLVGLSEQGARLGQVLSNDEALRRLAIEHGFRTSDAASFQAQARQRHLAVPAELIQVIDPPSYEILEGMIQAIEQLMN
ncbi:MAG: hypothetical protein FNT29_08320 [Halothiobacillaceae bacterium]|nr:MAG: hypothetical protein FNT29_08320 [Halothiobacillaceae bacterium]